MTKVLAEATTVQLAPEVGGFAVAPTVDWVQFQANPGGIRNWQNSYQVTERDPLSKYATMEAGEPVGFDATPELEHDLTKDLLDVIASPTFRSIAKHSGNTGESLFRPTAVTATGYTVPTLGALTQGLLIKAQGFATAANNGVKLVGAGSIATEIKTLGLVAEVVDPQAGATVEVCGVQGALGDIQIDIDGNLISTVLDLTTLGLYAGQWLAIGGATTATRFATADYNGTAKIVSTTTTKITLARRSWTVGAADAGAGKTIELRFSRWYRNVSIDHADYREPTLHGELEELGPGPGGVATYVYGRGMGLKTHVINAPLESKIVSTLTFVAKDMADPVLVADRVAGATTSRRPMAAALWHTSCPQMQRVRITRIADNFPLAVEVNSWQFTMEHNVKPREIQGECGAVDLIYGKVQPSVTMEIYYTTSEVVKAMRDNPEVAWDAQIRNHQAGWILDMPYVRIRNGQRTFAANEAVMASLEVPGFREPSSNIVASLSVFADWPETP